MVKRLHVGFHECMRILTERAFKGYNNTPWSVWVIIESNRMYFAIQDDIFGVEKVVSLCKDLDALNKFLRRLKYMIKGILLIVVIAILLGESCTLLRDEDNDDFDPDEI